MASKPPAKKVPAKKAPAKKAAPKLAKHPKIDPDALNVYGLTHRQAEFVEQYLVDMNATQAAIRAGYSPATARSTGSENLQKPDIQAAIRRRRDELALATGATPELVLRQWLLVATADPRELVEVKVGCCRHCWGEGHRYQRTVGEMNADRERWAIKGGDQAEFDEAGGIGFNPLALPHPECPECGGDGEARVQVRDTRQLGPSGLALYAGAKMGKHGIEVQMRDRDAALEKLARHLGMFEKDNSQKRSSIAEWLASLSGNVLGPVGDANHGDDA